MEPLDVGLYGPFRSKCKVAFNDYLATNGGTIIKIADITKLTPGPYLQAFNMCNITKAFMKTGLWPIDRFVFGEVGFTSSFVTDRPQFVEIQNNIGL